MAPSELFDDLQQRGLVHQVSSPAVADALARPLTAYIGFDPTADSLHIGSLLPLLMLVRLQRAGHRPIAVVGGGTGLIGDPSGKSAERSMLSPEQLDANLAGMRRQIEQYVDFSGGRAQLVNNADWLGKLHLLDFLRDIGKHFSVNVMMTRDSVRLRLEERDHGISYTEFSYMLMQAYDYLHLFDAHGCTLQCGGSDQWGNILSGADLIRRLRNAEVHALTWPLVTRADGGKFGKSEEGNIWLDPRRTSPYRFYQFWLNAADADAEKYLKYFTFLPLAQIADTVRQAAAAPEKRLAQHLLADELTRLVHGDAALASAHRATAALFSKDADFRSLSPQELADAFAAAPSTELPAARLGTPEAGLVALLAETKMYESRGRARQDVSQGGVSVNNVTVTDANRVLGQEDVLAGGFIILRKGRKTYHVLRVT